MGPDATLSWSLSFTPLPSLDVATEVREILAPEVCSYIFLLTILWGSLRPQDKVSSSPQSELGRHWSLSICPAFSGQLTFLLQHLGLVFSFSKAQSCLQALAHAVQVACQTLSSALPWMTLASFSGLSHKLPPQQDLPQFPNLNYSPASPSAWLSLSKNPERPYALATGDQEALLVWCYLVYLSPPHDSGRGRGEVEGEDTKWLACALQISRV